MTTPLEQFLNALSESLADGSFVKLTLGKHRGDDPTLKNVYGKLTTVKHAARLSLTYRHATKDITKNFSFEDGVDAVRRLLGEEFLSGHLFTTTRDIRIEFNKRREARLTENSPTFTSPPTPEHDRKKRRLIETGGNVYLRALGVTNERGEVRERMGDKFRQINKFIETLGQLFASSPLAEKTDISVVDMGAGKGYLTFAVYDYLKNVLGKSPKVVGVEARAELVRLCNEVAREAGFEGLSFKQGFIRDYEIHSTDILIALHACDTATDEALYKGMTAGASIIIAAPCCHKELRPQIEAPEVLAAMLKHGIIFERQAEMLTDALRALLLESAGYRTSVFEFISTEHTRKNTMIAAVRVKDGRSAGESKRKFEELKRFYGVREQSLEKFLRGADAVSGRVPE